jgi:hypothetical protein
MRSHPLSGGLLPDSPDEGLLIRAGHFAPYAVDCSFCGAKRGEDCLAKGKYTYALSFHNARKAAVADWSDLEKYRAFAEVRAEHEQRRNASVAVLAEVRAARS